MRQKPKRSYRDGIGMAVVQRLVEVDRVRITKTHVFWSDGRRRKIHLVNTGYLAINGPHIGTIGVHRLLCWRYPGPAPSPRHDVDHKNRIRTDNRRSNLRWATSSENMLNVSAARKRQAAETLRTYMATQHGENNHHAKLINSNVVEMRELRRTTHESYREIGAKFGVTRITARKAVLGITFKNI